MDFLETIALLPVKAIGVLPYSSAEMVAWFSAGSFSDHFGLGTGAGGNPPDQHGTGNNPLTIVIGVVGVLVMMAVSVWLVRLLLEIFHGFIKYAIGWMLMMLIYQYIVHVVFSGTGILFASVNNDAAGRPHQGAGDGTGYPAHGDWFALVQRYFESRRQ